MKSLLIVFFALSWARDGEFIYFKNLLPPGTEKLIQAKCGGENGLTTLESGREKYCYSSPSAFYIDGAFSGNYNHEQCGVYGYLNVWVEFDRDGNFQHKAECVTL